MRILNNKSQYDIIREINYVFIQNDAWLCHKANFGSSSAFDVFVKCFYEMYDYSKKELCAETIMVAAEVLQE